VEGPAACRRRGRDLTPPDRPRRTPPHDQAPAGLCPIRSTGGCVARSSDPRTKRSTRGLRATPSPARSSLPGWPLRDLACRSGLDGAAGQPQSPEFVDRSPVPGHTLQSDGTLRRGPRVAGCADHSGWAVAIRNNWSPAPQLDYRHRLDAESLHYSWLPEDPESRRSSKRGSPVRLFSRRPPCRSPPAPVRDHIRNPTAAHPSRARRPTYRAS
jgi:hypothetical protein